MSDIAPIEWRTAAIENVRFPERVIDLIAVPYDQWTTVPYRDRMIEESFAPGAFGHIGNRAHKVPVNLEHRGDPIGRVVRLTPDDPVGLRAEVKIQRSDLGDRALDDAADDLVDGSVGFGVLPDNCQWEGRTRRRIVKAFLDHIALTYTPAYPGANVVAVRTAAAAAVTRHPSASATPNLDRIRADRLAAVYGVPL